MLGICQNGLLNLNQMFTFHWFSIPEESKLYSAFHSQNTLEWAERDGVEKSLHNNTDSFH